jgi:hypothetical protein
LRIKEYDWAQQGPTEIECPDELVKSFMDWMHNNKQWPDNPDLAIERWRHFHREWMAGRNEQALKQAAQEASDVCSAVTRAGTPCKNTMAVVGGLCAIHRRNVVAA